MNSTTTTKTIWVIQVRGDNGDNWGDCDQVSSGEADAIFVRDQLAGEEGNTWEYRVVRRVQTNEDTLI